MGADRAITLIISFTGSAVYQSLNNRLGQIGRVDDLGFGGTSMALRWNALVHHREDKPRSFAAPVPPRRMPSFAPSRTDSLEASQHASDISALQSAVLTPEALS